MTERGHKVVTFEIIIDPNEPHDIERVAKARRLRGWRDFGVHPNENPALRIKDRRAADPPIQLHSNRPKSA